MNIFEELKPQIQEFKETRDNVISAASLPSIDEGMSCGEPPFAVDDGTSYYAVIDANGDVEPLPFGYQVVDEDMQYDDVDYILSMPMSIAGKGMTTVRYVPLDEGFEVPGERGFCLETAEDSEAWDVIGQTVEQLQQEVNEKALFSLSQRLANAISRIYEDCEELETVDQMISALVLESSLLATLFLQSYQHALGAFEDEMSAAGGDDDDE